MSSVLHIHSDSAPSSSSRIAALADLRAVRRHRRLGDVAWGDLAYRVYTTALGTIVLVIFASGLIGDEPLSTAATSHVLEWGPRWAGLLAGVMMILGARSGARGGPIALDSADVHNLLLAPIDRGKVLLRPAAGRVGYGAAGVGAAGALVGLLLAQRIPGGNLAFVSSGIIFGVLAAFGMYGTALLTASRQIPAWLVIVAAGLLSTLSVAELVGLITWSPLNELGSIVLWPLEFTPLSAIPAIAIIGVTVLGMFWIGGLSLEAAQRRTSLVGQLRFAVTQQDLRSALLLRRQLASEHSRSNNRLRWLSNLIGSRLPVTSRSLASIGRWPNVRIIRVLLLCIGAGLAARGIWNGTTPLIIVAGLCTFVAALDAIEPLAQEIDHPLIVNSYPQIRGVLFLRYLAVPITVMFIGLVAGLGIALIVQRSSAMIVAVVVTTVTAAASSVAGVAVSVVGEAVLSSTDQAMMPPEVAGPRVVLRTIWPPLVSMSGFAPIIAAQLAGRNGGDADAAATMAALLPLALSAAVFVWVRFRDDIHDSMREAMGG